MEMVVCVIDEKDTDTCPEISMLFLVQVFLKWCLFCLFRQM